MSNGEKYICIARTVEKGIGRFGQSKSILSIGLGCEAKYAKDFIYTENMNINDKSSEGFNIFYEAHAVPIIEKLELKEIDANEAFEDIVDHHVFLDLIDESMTMVLGFFHEDEDETILKNFSWKIILLLSNYLTILKFNLLFGNYQSWNYRLY